jgi:hypothetical protein
MRTLELANGVFNRLAFVRFMLLPVMLGGEFSIAYFLGWIQAAGKRFSTCVLRFNMLDQPVFLEVDLTANPAFAHLRVPMSTHLFGRKKVVALFASCFVRVVSAPCPTSTMFVGALSLHRGQPMKFNHTFELNGRYLCGTSCSAFVLGSIRPVSFAVVRFAERGECLSSAILDRSVLDPRPFR